MFKVLYVLVHVPISQAAEDFPEDILVSADACSAFIGRMLLKTPPSQKQAAR